MGDETWFRGEGIGVPPGKPGGSLHDFGDGMYLTDRSDVAEVYAARRATSPDGKQVFTVTLNRASLGRVLDLSSDPRWHQFMTDRSEPAFRKQSRLDFLKIKQELYGQFFNEFVRRYKIEPESHDAVIGPEYNLGGRQLCILHKNGLPSKLQVRVRALFRLASPGGKPTVGGETVPLRTSAGPPPVRLPTSGPLVGRFRAGLRISVRVGVAVGVTVLLQLVADWIWEYIDKLHLEKALDKLQPVIDEKLAAYTQKSLALTSVGRVPYANIVLKVEIFSGTPAGVSVRTPPVVSLTDVSVTHTKLEGAGAPKSQYIPGSAGNLTAYPLFLSAPLSFPKERVDLFRNAINELYWYENVLDDRDGVLDRSDVERLSREKREREVWMEAAFGPFPLPPVGPKQRRYSIYGWFDDE